MFYVMFYKIKVHWIKITGLSFMVIKFYIHHIYVKYCFKDKQDNLGKTRKLNIFIESHIFKDKNK